MTRNKFPTSISIDKAHASMLEELSQLLHVSRSEVVSQAVGAMYIRETMNRLGGAK